MPTPQQPDTAMLKSPGGAAQKRLSLGLIVVAVTSTLVASTCCVLPLVLVLVGITGAWMVNLTSLQPYTPLFTGIAVVALGCAGYLIFLKPARTCSYPEGAACETTRPYIKGVFILCAFFIALLLLFPLFAPLFY